MLHGSMCLESFIIVKEPTERAISFPIGWVANGSLIKWRWVITWLNVFFNQHKHCSSLIAVNQCCGPSLGSHGRFLLSHHRSMQLRSVHLALASSHRSRHRWRNRNWNWHCLNFFFKYSHLRVCKSFVLFCFVFVNSSLYNHESLVLYGLLNLKIIIIGFVMFMLYGLWSRWYVRLLYCCLYKIMLLWWEN